MTQISYPRVGIPMTADQWGQIMQSIGTAVLDMGGWPYLLTGRDSVTDEVTIGVDELHGFNIAIMNGFMHYMDVPEKLSVPPVAADTVYEIGLTYDPLKHVEETGPISLGVWKVPADYSQGKNHIVLYRITRKPNVTLEQSAVTEIRQRISPVITVNNSSELPNVNTHLVETIATTRDKGEFYRLQKSTDGSNIVKWQKINATDPAVTAATHQATGSTIMKRHFTGSVQVEVGTNEKDAINRGYLDSALGGTNTGADWTAATPYPTPHSIMRRWDSGVARVGTTDGVSRHDIVNVEFADSRYRRQSSSIDARDISKTGGDVWWEIVSGSTRAYSNQVGASTWATVAVTSEGRFFRYGSSSARWKTNIEDANYDTSKVMQFRLKRYDRTDVPEITGEYGLIAEEVYKIAPELVNLDDDGKPVGIHYQELGKYLIPVVQEQDARITELEKENASLEAKYDDLLARVAKLEGNNAA